MEHDHQSSKTEGKTVGPPARKNATPHVSSQARAVFDLQRAAGNRAVAKMLTSSAKGPKVRRTPVTVQRELSPSFETALETAITKGAVDQSKFDINKFAEALVGAAGDTSKTTGGEKAGKTLSTKLKLGGAAPTKESIAEKRAELAKKSTPQARKEARELKKQQEALDADETRMENEDKLMELDPTVKSPPTRKQMSDKDLQDHIDELESKKKDEEARDKYMKSLRTPKMSAGQVSSMRGLI